MIQRRHALALLLVGYALAGHAPRLIADDAKPAPAGPKITYDEQVRPIFREHCFTCHNQNTAKSGLVLETYAKLMAGGASGDVVIAGNAADSRLW
jgi:Planctomycete cytochrome C